MTDPLVIDLLDVRALVHLGVSAEERATPQTVLVSLSLRLDRPRHAPDRLHATIDYDPLIDFVQSVLPERGPFELIETIADQCAAFALTSAAAVRSVEIRVKKPSVLGPEAGLVQVRLLRTKENPA